MTALIDLVRTDEAVRDIVNNAAIGHRNAARKINERYAKPVTSERSVRRYRSKRPEDLRANFDKPEAPRVLGGSGWVPGIDIDPAAGGEFRTVPRMADPDDPEPEEAALLAEFDLDPEVWEIVSARKSLWQGGKDGGWLEARRVSFRKRSASTSAAELDIDGIMSKYTRPRPHQGPVSESARIMLVASGDLQLGKPEGGGTPAIIDRFCRITDEIAQQLSLYPGDQVLILPWLGDCIEGIVSQNSRLIAQLDISVTEQVRAYRRLMMHQIAKLSCLAEKVIIPVVPGNHDETTRVQQMPMSDSWAIEGASAVNDWMEGRPEYAHVEFVFPHEQEPDITIFLAKDDHPYTITFIHGHTMGSNPGRVIDWWKGQSHGRQAAGQADMLVSAHYHHLRVEHTGGNRTWIQIPALDGGSSWYRHRQGDDPPTGIVTVEITPGVGQGWKGLSVHS